jgi:hypothetical protein
MDGNKINSLKSSATNAQQSQQMLCTGYNIEQRECNLFECKGKKNKNGCCHL